MTGNWQDRNESELLQLQKATKKMKFISRMKCTHAPRHGSSCNAYEFKAQKPVAVPSQVIIDPGCCTPESISSVTKLQEGAIKGLHHSQGTGIGAAAGSHGEQLNGHSTCDTQAVDNAGTLDRKRIMPK